MSSEKKTTSNSHRQRKKSSASFVIHHESPEISTGSHNGDSVFYHHHHPEPIKTVSSSMDNIVNTNITSPIHQRSRHSSGSVDGESSVWVTPQKLSRTQSESGTHTKSVAFILPENDDVFSDTNSSFDTLPSPTFGEIGSLHRPVAIEEELFAKVNQLNSLVLLWRKRWKQQKECSDSLMQQMQYTKQECAGMVGHVKEAYNEKVKGLCKDLHKQMKQRQRVEQEKDVIMQRLNKIIAEKDSERINFKDMLERKDEEIAVGLSKQEEARTTIRAIKKELSKVKRENEKLVRHIAKLRIHIANVEENKASAPPLQRRINCDGECEHKVLFELAIERVRFYDDLLCHRQWNNENGRYVVKTNPHDPLNMSVESVPDLHSKDDVFDESYPRISLNSSYSSTHEVKSAIVSNDSHQNRQSSEHDHYGEHKEQLLKVYDGTGDSPNGPVVISTEPGAENGLDLTKESAEVNTNLECSDTSANSDSALSGEGYTPSLHLPLCKSLTSDTPTQQKKVISLSRSKTWVAPRPDSPVDSGNCSPCFSPGGHCTEDNLNEHHQSSSSPRLARSGFEGLRERRNGITDTKLDASLQLKLSKPKKTHEFGDLLKKFTFHSGGGDPGVKDREISLLNNNNNNRKTGFMNLGVSMLTRKKSNSLKEV